MLTRTAHCVQTPRWQKAMAAAIRDPEELLDRLELPHKLLPAARNAAQLFPLRVPHSYVDRMEKGNPADPLLRQVLPLHAEYSTAKGYSTDPVGDLQAMTIPGLLHKYSGRVLLVTTGACSIHCRYCFRRHFPYDDANPLSKNWQLALDYIANDPSIHEVILSGGDPLSLTDQRLHQLVTALSTIGHLKRLRIHTRQPIVLPERVNNELLEWLMSTRLQTVIVVHCNHPNEIDALVRKGLLALKQCGVSLLNQSVLLRDVNDEVTILSRLSEVLFEAGVLPYYLHMLDKVQGAQHFEVHEVHALHLMHELHTHLPGYLVPRLVREHPGQAYKVPIENFA